MTTTEGSAPTAAPAEPADRTWQPGLFAAALVGLVSVGVALGIAELLAALGSWVGFLHAGASPLTALGSTFIDLTPEWLKEFAIRKFGQHDKDALRAGMGVTLVLVAALVGLIGRRRPRIAVGLTAVLIGLTLTAIWTRTGTSIADGLPILIGAAAGIWLLVSAFRRTVVTHTATVPGPVDRGIGAPLPPSDVEDAEPLSTKDSRSGAHHPMALHSVRPAPNRRQFFTLAAVGAVVAVASGALARWIPSTAAVAASRARATVPTTRDVQRIPAGVDLKVPGQPPFVTPNADFYRVDTAFTPPALRAEDWRLRVHGMVGKELSVDYAALTARPQIERTITLTCVSNEVGGDLAGTASWIGTRIDDLLAEAAPQSGADCVLCTSVDGFTISAPLEALTDGRDALLAVAMNGEVLPVEHGFPVRMVVPGLYGYVSATKWVVDMEVTQFAKVTAYWTSRGWSAQAPIKTSSRIDVPKGFATFQAGQTIAIAGVAWAQHRGITSVQVQIDDGPWQPADLSEPLSIDTWRQWKFPWKATSGLHTIRCRAVDGTGAVQIAADQPPMPDGSTGYDSRSVTIS